MHVDCNRFGGWDLIVIIETVFLAGSTVLFFLLDNEGRDEISLILDMLAEKTGENCLVEHKQRIASGLVYVHAGFVLCVLLALLAMWLGDKTDLFNTALSFLGFVVCGCACAVRTYGASTIKDNEGFRNNCIILSVVLGCATITFALEAGYRLYLGIRYFNCAFHPFIIGYPSGVFLTVQMLLACGVLSFYHTGMLNHENVHKLNITGPKTDDPQADLEFDGYLHLFREVSTNAAAYSGVVIYIILFLGMIFSDFYLAITTFGSLFIGSLYLSAGSLWMLSIAQEFSLEKQDVVKESSIGNGSVFGFAIANVLTGMAYIVASLSYFCCCPAVGEKK